MLSVSVQQDPHGMIPSQEELQIRGYQGPWKSNHSNREGLLELKMSSQKTKSNQYPACTDENLLNITQTTAIHDQKSTGQQMNMMTGEFPEKAQGITESIFENMNPEFADGISRPVPTSRKGTNKLVFSLNRNSIAHPPEFPLQLSESCLGKRKLTIPEQSENPMARKETVSIARNGPSRIKCGALHPSQVMVMGFSASSAIPIPKQVLAHLCTLKMPRLSSTDLSAASASCTLYPQGKLSASESLLVDHFVHHFLSSQALEAGQLAAFTTKIAANYLLFIERAKQGSMRARHSAQGALRKAKATAVLYIHKIAKNLANASGVLGARQHHSRSRLEVVASKSYPVKNAIQSPKTQQTQLETCLGTSHNTTTSTTDQQDAKPPQISLVVPGHSVRTLFTGSLLNRNTDLQRTPEKVNMSFSWSANLSSANKSVLLAVDTSRPQRGSESSQELLNSILNVGSKGRNARIEAGPLHPKLVLEARQEDHRMQESIMKKSMWDKASTAAEDHSCSGLISSSPLKAFAPFKEELYVCAPTVIPGTTQTAQKPTRGGVTQPDFHSESRTGLACLRFPEDRAQFSILPGSETDQSPILFRKLTF